MFAGNLSDGRIQLFQPMGAELWTCWKETADPDSGWTAWSPFPIDIECQGVGNGGAAALGGNDETVIFVPHGGVPDPGLVGGPDLTWATKASADSNSEWVGFLGVGPGAEYASADEGEAGVSGVTYVTAVARDDGRIQVFFYWCNGLVQDLGNQVWWYAAEMLNCTQTSSDPGIGGEWTGWDYGLGNIDCENQPAVVSLPDGRLQIFAVDGRGEILTSWITEPGGSDWSLWEVMQGPVAVPEPAGIPSLAAARRADRRAQLWAAFNEGVYTRWKISHDPNSNWCDWGPFNKPLPGPASEVVAAPLSDGRLQIWFVMQDGSIYTSWETELTEEPNSQWTDVSPFGGPP